MTEFDKDSDETQFEAEEGVTDFEFREFTHSGAISPAGSLTPKGQFKRTIEGDV